MKTIVFIHIPKTGGSSLIAAFRREYGSDLYHIAPNRADPRGFANFLAIPKKQFRAIAGHVAYGVDEFIAGEVNYATMLREPADRAVSDYRYIRRRSGHPLHQHAMSLEINDFFASRCAALTDNLQTRMIAGGLNIGTQPFDRPVNEDDLQRALDNLQNFSVIGLTEKFDESLVLIAEKLNWTRPVVSFVTNQAPSAAQVQVDGGLVSLDQRLYDSATAIDFSSVGSEQISALRRRSMGPRMIRSLTDVVRRWIPSFYVPDWRSSKQASGERVRF